MLPMRRRGMPPPRSRMWMVTSSRPLTAKTVTEKNDARHKLNFHFKSKNLSSLKDNTVTDNNKYPLQLVIQVYSDIKTVLRQG